MRYLSFLLLFVLLISLVQNTVSIPLPNCDRDKCTPTDPCADSYGDCDTNNDCVLNTTCQFDIGLDYGCPQWTDICVYDSGLIPSSTSSSSSSASMISSSSISSSAASTTSSSSSSRIASSSSSSSSSSSVVTLPTTTILPNCRIDRCTPLNPCTPGYGDCDINDDCVLNSSCHFDVGSNYGCPLWVDICDYNPDLRVQGCQILSLPNREYFQQNNIIASKASGGGCIVITAPNITFDCQGYSITNSSFDSVGIYSTQINTILKNCTVSVGYTEGYGLRLEGANNSRVYNSNFNNQSTGIYLISTYNAILENDTAYGNYIGVTLTSSSYNNLSKVVVPTQSPLIGSHLGEYSKAAGVEISPDELENSLENMLFRDGSRFVEPSRIGGNSKIRAAPSNQSTLVYVDALYDSIPYDSQSRGSILNSIIGVLLINSSSYNTLSSVTVNNSVFGIVIGRNSSHNTLSNTKVNLAFFGIAVGNSTHTKFSTVTTLGNFFAILMVRNSSYTNMSGVTCSLNLYGIIMGAGSNNSFYNVIASRNVAGLLLYSNDYNNISNIRANNNTVFGLGIYYSTGNYVRNTNLSENRAYDFFLDSESHEDCMNVLDNVSSSGGRLIRYYNSSVTLSNNIFPELYLCGADYSILDNITIYGSSSYNNNGLVLLVTNWSNITNINSSENYEGVDMVYSSHNMLTNLTVNNNSGDGVYLDTVAYNTFSEITANFNGDDGVDLGYCYHTSFSNITTNNNSYEGVYVYYSNNTHFSNITTSSNVGGVYSYRSSNNTFSTVTSENNSWDGFTISYGFYNVISNLDTRNNTAFGIHFYASVGNNISEANISQSGNTGIYLEYSNNSNLRNAYISNSSFYDIYSSDTSTNNVLLNVTYDKNTEYMDSSSNMIRKWYLDVYVNDTLGNGLDSVNVSAWNVFNTLSLVNLTNSQGHIVPYPMSEYVNNGTRTYYSNYTLSLMKSGYSRQNRSINLTGNTFEYFTFPSICAKGGC